MTPEIRLWIELLVFLSGAGKFIHFWVVEDSFERVQTWNEELDILTVGRQSQWHDATCRNNGDGFVL